MACTDMAIRLEVDGLATGSSASTKSRSLELLLVLHTLLGAAVLHLQRTIRTRYVARLGEVDCNVLSYASFRSGSYPILRSVPPVQVHWRSA